MADSESCVTESVTTPLDGIVHDAAAHAGLNPDTAEVVDVGLVDGELELELRGEK